LIVSETENHYEATNATCRAEIKSCQESQATALAAGSRPVSFGVDTSL
jgi:hypothetical protein